MVKIASFQNTNTCTFGFFHIKHQQYAQNYNIFSMLPHAWAKDFTNVYPICVRSCQ